MAHAIRLKQDSIAKNVQTQVFVVKIDDSHCRFTPL